MVYAASEDSGPPWQQPSLISLRCWHGGSLDPWLPFKRTTKTTCMIRLGGTQAGVRLCMARMQLYLFRHVVAQLCININQLSR